MNFLCRLVVPSAVVGPFSPYIWTIGIVHSRHTSLFLEDRFAVPVQVGRDHVMIQGFPESHVLGLCQGKEVDVEAQGVGWVKGKGKEVSLSFALHELDKIAIGDRRVVEAVEGHVVEGGSDGRCGRGHCIERCWKVSEDVVEFSKCS